MMKEFSLRQIIDNFTHITEHSKTLIDLFFTSRPDLYVSGVIPVGFSDHSAIFAVCKLHRLKPPPPRVINTRNFKRFNRDTLIEGLNKGPWLLINSFADVEDSWNSFKQLFGEVASSHTPRIRVRDSGQKVPWLTREVKQLMNERDHFHNLALRTNNGNGSKSSSAAAHTANKAKDKFHIFNRFLVSCAEDLRSTHRSSTRSFFKWLPQIDHPEKFKLRKITVSEVRKALKELKSKVLMVFQLVYLKTDQTPWLLHCLSFLI